MAYLDVVGIGQLHPDQLSFLGGQLFGLNANRIAADNRDPRVRSLADDLIHGVKTDGFLEHRGLGHPEFGASAKLNAKDKSAPKNGENDGEQHQRRANQVPNSSFTHEIN